MTSPRLTRMTDAVRTLYDRNRQRGTAEWCGLAYDFVCPSTGTYPFQWFWDSCFHAVVLSHFDPERAPGGLIFGYGTVTETQIDDGVRLVAQALAPAR